MNRRCLGHRLARGDGSRGKSGAPSGRGERRSRKYVLKALKKEGRKSAVDRSGAFPTPSRGDPPIVMGLGITFFILSAFGRPWVPPHLRRCYTKIPHGKSDLCTGLNQHTCRQRKHRHYSGNRHYSACADTTRCFHTCQATSPRHYSGQPRQPALLRMY